MNMYMSTSINTESASPQRVVVIGASAGGLHALLQILPALPADYPLPLAVVLHLPPDKDSALANLLDAHCELTVKEAEDKEPLSPGCVYVAPPNYHLLIEPDFSLSLSNDEEVLYSRPSIDVLFESAADACGSGVMGVVLTGANQDGACGLRAICDAGGQALVQTPHTAEVATMPGAALDLCPEARALTLPQIASALTSELLSLS